MTKPPADLLYRCLRRPNYAERVRPEDWNWLIRVARHERLLGTLALRVAHVNMPAMARDLLEEARLDAERGQDRIRFEIHRMAEALADQDFPVVLLKGGAYLMADLPALPGREIGDLDILVPEGRIDDAEAALKEAGWKSVKARGDYDDHYYREWMHELPPLAHKTRGNVIDLHHNILPRTARLKPDIDGMIARAVPITADLHILAPADMIIHAAIHCAYDGDFHGGARNLWDIDRLVRHFAAEHTAFWAQLETQARAQGIMQPVRRALTLTNHFYETPIVGAFRKIKGLVDSAAIRKLTAHGPYGEPKGGLRSFFLYLRGHWLRMPPLMLAKHLFTKWRARRAEARLEADRKKAPVQPPPSR
ncbi:MAG: nucleotidyltransferase family protein [Pacificimonas sp.]|jgi:hypothetical protein|nr:nucleotidyltransferase family protein [Pacificimonas sp.]